MDETNNIRCFMIMRFTTGVYYVITEYFNSDTFTKELFAEFIKNTLTPDELEQLRNISISVTVGGLKKNIIKKPLFIKENVCKFDKEYFIN